VSLGSVLIRLNAAFFVVYGLAFVLAPEAVGRAITGSAPDTSSGVIDMRATYGGMTVAVGRRSPIQLTRIAAWRHTLAAGPSPVSALAGR
jgi:hypothetical protein